jgi:hypothetical protein
MSFASGGRNATLAVCKLWSGLLLLSVPAGLMAQGPQGVKGDAAAGKQLFTGVRPFQNGGPPCATCHSVAGIGFPNGGTMGPDLTGVSSKFGPEGMDAMVQTLYFPSMVPLFQNRPLTPREQTDLKAFFQSVASLPTPPTYTPGFGLVALGGMGVLLGATWAIWRHRLRGVRESLVGAAPENAHELD